VSAELVILWNTVRVSLFRSLIGYSNVIAHRLLKREFIAVLHALSFMEIWKVKWNERQV
jgi:hypothetical protein